MEFACTPMSHVSRARESDEFTCSNAIFAEAKEGYRLNGETVSILRSRCQFQILWRGKLDMTWTPLSNAEVSIAGNALTAKKRIKF